MSEVTKYVVSADDLHHCGIELLIESPANYIGEILVVWEKNCSSDLGFLVDPHEALELARRLIQAANRTLNSRAARSE